MTPKLLRFFEQRRGIRKDTLETFGVTMPEDDLACFPYPHGDVKMRAGTLTDGKKRMWWRDASRARSLYGEDHVPTGADVAFLVEGETDTLRLWQALADAGKSNVAVLGLSGMNWWRPEFVDSFDRYRRVFVVFDNDDPYANKTAVDSANKAWLAIRKGLGPKASRVTLPGGVKDICEFFLAHDVPGTSAAIEMLTALCKSAAAPKLNFSPLDLRADPPAYDWLVKDWIAKGDVVTVFGEPGSGKSWLTMSLAAATASADQRWMNIPLLRSGKVVYIDQENPQDVVQHRFSQLGIGGPDSGPEIENLHVLWGHYIDLERDLEALMEDLLYLQPELLVWDSLSTAHNRKESDPAEMAAFFKSAVMPLARDTGTTCIYIHHVNKAKDDASFQRMRGASSIPGFIDFGIDVRVEGSKSRAIPYKPRRGQAASGFEFQIEDYIVDGKRTTRVERLDRRVDI